MSKLYKVIDILTIIFLVFLTVSISITQAALYLAIIGAVYLHKDKLAERTKDVKITLPILLFFAASVVSIIFYNEPVEQLKAAKKIKIIFIFLSYYLFTVLRPDLKSIKKYFLIFISAFGVTLIYVVLQLYLGRGVLPYRYDRFQFEAGVRIYPMYGQFSSIVLMMIMPIMLFAKRVSKSEKALFILMLAPIFFSLYLSTSRTSIVSIIIATSIMLILKKKRIYLTLFLALLLAGGAFYGSKKNNLISSIINITDQTNKRYFSNMSRIKMMQDTLDIFKADPITGIGFGGYKYYSRELGRGHDKIFNDYFNVLATTGILGFIPFIWLIFMLLKEHSKSAGIIKINSPPNDFYNNLSFGIFLGFISFLINAMLEPVFFNSEPLIFMLIFLSMNTVIIHKIVVEPSGLP